MSVARVLTYNVHRCLGVDGKLSPARIAEVVESCRPDIIALQELDVRRARSGGVDQAHEIARALDVRHLHFNAALRVMEEEYGDAILTTRPSRLVRAGPLPGLPRRPWLEPRGALWVAVDMDGVEVQIVNTHFGLWRLERQAQMAELLGPDWLGHPSCRDPVILLGDFNAVPRSGAYRQAGARLRDAQAVGPKPMRATFPSRFPFLRIDHVFIGGGVEVMDVEVVRTPLARIASDHLPLVAELRFLKPSSQAEAPASMDRPAHPRVPLL